MKSEFKLAFIGAVASLMGTFPADASTLEIDASSVGGALNQGSGWPIIDNYFTVGVNDGWDGFGDPIRSAVEFDLSQFSSEDIIHSATLSLPYQDSYDEAGGGYTSTPFPMDLHSYVGDGTVAGSDLDTNNYYATLSSFSAINVTSLIQNAIVDGDDYVGMMFRFGNENRDNTTNSFYSPSASNPYRLSVDYTAVPEPASGLLVAGGLAFMFRRKRGRGSVA